MKVKLLSSMGLISKGTVLPVRKPSVDQSDECIYQVIEGPHSGLTIVGSLRHFLEIPAEKSFSEKEWNDLENYYLAKLDKEREEKERAQALTRSLTSEMNKKNEEIKRLDFFVTALSVGLKASSEAIQILKGFDKAKQNG